jgi:hypothetical protein
VFFFLLPLVFSLTAAVFGIYLRLAFSPSMSFYTSPITHATLISSAVSSPLFQCGFASARCFLTHTLFFKLICDLLPHQCLSIQAPSPTQIPLVTAVFSLLHTRRFQRLSVICFPINVCLYKPHYPRNSLPH